MSEPEDLRAEMAQIRADVDQLRAELVDVRVLASLADRDASDVRSALTGITRAQSALRETQMEQGQTLRQLSDAVGILVVEQQRQGEVLTQHTQALHQQGEVLTQHTQALHQQGEVLTQHTQALHQQGEVLTQHTQALHQQGEVLTQHGEMLAEILRRLPAPPAE